MGNHVMQFCAILHCRLESLLTVITRSTFSYEGNECGFDVCSVDLCITSIACMKEVYSKWQLNQANCICEGA